MEGFADIDMRVMAASWKAALRTPRWSCNLGRFPEGARANSERVSLCVTLAAYSIRKIRGILKQKMAARLISFENLNTFFSRGVDNSERLGTAKYD
jgi:hypothetical protein